MVTYHAVDNRHQARLAAFGLGQSILHRAAQVVDSHQDTAVILASSDRKIKAGGATGRHIAAIVRGGHVVTVLLTNKPTTGKLRVSQVVRLVA